mgnify:CR=1 FL=1
MRRGPSLKRKAEPDPIYNSVLVSQIINQVLLDGKKDLASGIVYSALKLVEKQSGSDPINVLKDAFENIKPQIETKSRRVGGTNYQVPMEVPYRRSTTLAIRWLVGSSRKRERKQCPKDLEEKFWMQATKQELLSKKEKMSIKWHSQI